jgi:hypothetical protein
MCKHTYTYKLKMNQTTRGKIIERAVKVESSIRELLALILKIDKDKSTAFGNKKPLAFSNKIDILCDLDYMTKEYRKMFQTFSEIRNKFAHINEVDSFVKCFDILHDKKTKFLSEFANEHITKVEDEELKLSLCFENLCIKIRIWLEASIVRQRDIDSQELKKTAIVESLRRNINQYSDINNFEIVKKEMAYLKNLLEEIKPDTEFNSILNDLLQKNEGIIDN